MGKKLFVQLVKKAHELTKSMKGEYTCTYKEQYAINFKQLAKESKESQIISKEMMTDQKAFNNEIIINPISKKKNSSKKIFAIVDDVNYIAYSTKDMAEFLATEMGFKGDIKRWIKSEIPKKYQHRVKCFKKIGA